jgi:ADP-ribose pyrophosphatase YjhB (NUDIX family)
MNPLLLVNVALLSVVDARLRVLLVRRAEPPERGRWALPGGALEPDVDSDLDTAVRRVLRSLIDIDVTHLDQVRTFGGTRRDPRGWSISVSFYALLPSDLGHVLAGGNVAAMKWDDAAQLGHRLAFDHDAQLGAALKVLRDKVERHALPLHLLPERFKLSALQRTCEAIVDRSIDKGVFRRRLKGSPDLVQVHGEFEVGRQRPAQLYRASRKFEF